MESPIRKSDGSLGLAGSGSGRLGLGLALLMEMKDTSFYGEKDLTKYLAPPFVVGIPRLSTPKEERQRKLKNLCQLAAASAMVLVVLAAELYVYRRG